MGQIQFVPCKTFGETINEINDLCNSLAKQEIEDETRVYDETIAEQVKEAHVPVSVSYNQVLDQHVKHGIKQLADVAKHEKGAMYLTEVDVKLFAEIERHQRNLAHEKKEDLTEFEKIHIRTAKHQIIYKQKMIDGVRELYKTTFGKEYVQDKVLVDMIQSKHRYNALKMEYDDMSRVKRSAYRPPEVDYIVKSLEMAIAHEKNVLAELSAAISGKVY